MVGDRLRKGVRFVSERIKDKWLSLLQINPTFNFMSSQNGSSSDQVSSSNLSACWAIDLTMCFSSNFISSHHSMAHALPREHRWRVNFVEVRTFLRLQVHGTILNSFKLGRKLKCDGIKPSCANCDRRGYPCTYAPVSG